MIRLHRLVLLLIRLASAVISKDREYRGRRGEEMMSSQTLNLPSDDRRMTSTSGQASVTGHGVVSGGHSTDRAPTPQRRSSRLTSSYVSSDRDFGLSQTSSSNRYLYETSFDDDSGRQRVTAV